MPHKTADFTNININGRRDGGSSSDIIINITNHSSNIAADDSVIISDPLRGKGSQQQEVDLVRDLVVTLNSPNGYRELQADVTGVSVDTTEVLLVSGNQNININDGNSSDIAANNDSNMATTEQTVPTGRQDLPTTMKPAEPKLANKELVIGTRNIPSGRSTRLETALQALSIVGVDICFLTETKLTESIYTRFS